MRVRSRVLVGVGAQGVASLSNVAVALFVARTLGSSELGRFSLVFATLSLATAIQSAWVGDGLAVLGPAGEAAGRWWQHVLTVSSTAVTTAALAWTRQFSLVEEAVYAVLCVCWLYEEFGRQWFMAHQRFAAQGTNDLVYLVVSVTALVIVQTSDHAGLAEVLAAMAVAAACAVVAGQVVTPRERRVWRRSDPNRDLGAYQRYGLWRSAQAATGALSTVTTRGMTAGGLGLRTLGNLELGRNVAAPAMSALAGLANVLLPIHSADARANRSRNFRRATVLLTAAVACYSVVVVVWAPFFVHLLGGRDYPVSRIVLTGWLAVAVVTAASQNLSVKSLVVLPSRRVFFLRTAGTLTTIGLVGLACLLRAAEAVPFASAAGALVSAAGLYVAIRSADRAAETEATRESGGGGPAHAGDRAPGRLLMERDPAG